MKLIPILLASVSLMTSPTIFADFAASQQKTLITSTSKTVDIQSSLHNSSCLHAKNYQHKDTSTNPLAKSLQSKEASTRTRYAGSENLNTDNIGINFLNLRVGLVKSTLVNKRYANPNRYQRRIDLPMRKNLQSNPNLEPVFESIRIKSGTQTIPFSYMSKNSSNVSNVLKPTSIHISESDIDFLVETVNAKYDLNKKSGLKHLSSLDANNLINHDSACIQDSKFI